MELYLVFDWYPDTLATLYQYSDSGIDGCAVPNLQITKKSLIKIVSAVDNIHKCGCNFRDITLDDVFSSGWDEHSVALAGFNLCEPATLSEGKEIYFVGIMILQLLFCCHYNTRLSKAQLASVKELAKQGSLDSLRQQVQQLIRFDPFLAELIVQCLNSSAQKRPSKREVVQILTGGKRYMRTCNAVIEFGKMACVGNVFELIFQRRFETIFLGKTFLSSVISEVAEKIKLCKNEDFAFLTIWESFDRVVLLTLANLLSTFVV